ncbi:MAG: hypothetical protein NTW20_15365 [Rhodobacterales bacterium]|nr:hypothetical protein [Rhodobacterales bacterium]
MSRLPVEVSGKHGPARGETLPFQMASGQSGGGFLARRTISSGQLPEDAEIVSIPYQKQAATPDRPLPSAESFTVTKKSTLAG